MNIRPMTSADLPQVDDIFRLAFGTQFGLRDPMQFRRGATLAEGRFSMYPDGCFVAHSDDRMAGFGIANHWGSVGFLGPVCVHPDFQGHGLARTLTSRCMAQIDAWGCLAAGLFTLPSSPLHLRLYQEFGFWPRQLTMVMAREPAGLVLPDIAYERLSDSAEPQHRVLDDASALTNLAFEGLQLRSEITRPAATGCGDTLYFYDGLALGGLAVCHYGEGSEAGADSLYVKFAQVRPGDGAQARFVKMIRVVAAEAVRKQLPKVVLGVNTGRHDAYRTLLDLGFRTEMQGVRMHRPNIELFDSSDCFVVDDWR